MNLSDEEAADNVADTDTQSPQSAAESEAIESESDAYQTDTVTNVGLDQIASATADQTQMIALAQAGSTLIASSAQADKDKRLNQLNSVSNWPDLYDKAVADAKLALTDSQADADLGGIDGKAVADQQFLTADAGDWQIMIDAEAQTNDQLAHEEDDEAKSSDETTAQHESDALKAEAAADQTQGNADASGEAAFQIAQGNETATIWNWLAGQLGNTPWAQSQAGLAGALANWASTAAANYQTYVTALGTAETAYAASNASQFLTEIDGIDQADDTAANTAADDGQTLTDALTSDEATFELALSPAGANYQKEVGQAQHDYREAVAQADHDLAIGVVGTGYADATATYEAGLAAAQSARTAAYDQAYADFAAVVGPAMTLQGTDDANAQQTDSDDDAAANLTDITANNAAVDAYDDAESTDYDAQQKAGDQALHDMQSANAAGQAAAIQAFDQANASPWADLAAAQAAALAAQQTSQAAAQLTQSNASADAQETAEQARADALSAKDDALAQAEDTQATTDAQAAHDQAVAQAAATDAVFGYLPDTLIAPADGPDPTLTADFNEGYEANEFHLLGYGGTFWQIAQLEVSWVENIGPANLTACGVAALVNYDWQLHGMPMIWGLLGGSGTVITPGAGDMAGANNVIPGASLGYGNPASYYLRDMVRVDSLPIGGVFGPAMHLTGPSADLLNLDNAPSAVGEGGYSQSPLPTTTAGTQPAAGTQQTAAPSLMNVPAQPQGLAMQVAGAPAGGVQSNGNANAQPGNQSSDAAAAGNGSDTVNAATISARPSAVVIVLIANPEADPIRLEAALNNRSSGEPESATGTLQLQLAAPDKTAEAPIFGAPASASATSNAADGANSAGSTMNSVPNFQIVGIGVLQTRAKPAAPDPVIELSRKVDELRKPFSKHDPVFGDLTEGLQNNRLAAPNEERTGMQRLAVEMGYMLFTLKKQMDELQQKIDNARRNSDDDRAALKELRGQKAAAAEYYKEVLSAYNAYDLSDVEVGATVPGGPEMDRHYTGTGADMESDREMFEQVFLIANMIARPPVGNHSVTNASLDLFESMLSTLQQPRVAGALRAAGGLAEIPAGAATGNPAIFILAAANGADNFSAGLTTVITGEQASTLLAKLLSGTASNVGFSDSTAATIGAVGDMAAPIVILGVGGLVKSGTSAELVELSILNRNFVPDGGRVLQNMTDQVNGKFILNIRLANTVLSEEELIAAGSSRGLARMHYGNALERLIRDEVLDDARLRNLFEHIGGAGRPDFIGKGLFKDMNFDITTEAQRAAHLGRAGYGDGLIIIIYERPPGFP